MGETWLLRLKTNGDSKLSSVGLFLAQVFCKLAMTFLVVGCITKACAQPSRLAGRDHDGSRLHLLQNVHRNVILSWRIGQAVASWISRQEFDHTSINRQVGFKFRFFLTSSISRSKKDNELLEILKQNKSAEHYQKRDRINEPI